MAFVPCQGKSACRDDGERCLVCGRSLHEVALLRDLIGRLADLAVVHNYANADQYAAYVAAKLEKVIAHRRDSSQAGE